MIHPFQRVLLLLVILSTAMVRYGWAESSAELPGQAADSDCGTALRPQDSLWLISTRHLGWPDPDHPYDPSFEILRYDAYGWQASDLSSLLGDQRDLSVFYIHGNRVDGSQVFRRGREAYDAVIRRSDQPAPTRFIVWSWPSTQICGPKRDVLAKAARTTPESYYLATVLAQLPPDSDVGLLGFSYGARIISGALHLLSGSAACGYRLDRADPLPSLNLHAVLMAAAMDRDWWLPSGGHSQCPAVATSLLVQYNPCDPVLKLYPRIDRRTRPKALGSTGFPWSTSLEGHTFQQQDVSRQLGKTHDVSRYFESASIMDAARDVLLRPGPRATSP